MKNLTFKLFLGLLLFTFNFLNAQNSPCDCADLNSSNLCNGGYFNSFTAANSSTPNPYTPSPTLSWTTIGQSYTFCTKYTAPAGVTKIGLLNYVKSKDAANVTCKFTRSWAAYANGCSTPVAPGTTNGNNAYEFPVTPGTEYRFCVTVTLTGACVDLTDIENYLYDATPSNPSCNVSAGTYTVTINGSPAPNPFDVVLEDGQTVSIVYNNDGVLPAPSLDQSGIGYDVFDCAPTFNPATEIPADDPCYLGTSFDLSFDISDVNNGGQSTAVAGKNELWYLPTTMDDMLKSSTGGNDDARGPDVNGDNCWTSAQAIHVTYNPPPPPACGSCSTPNCPVKQVATYADRSYTTNCNTLSDDISNATYVTHHTVKADANGALGLVQGLDIAPNPCPGLTRTAILKPITNTCTAAAIPVSVSNANSTLSGFNPEWYGLTPLANYVAIITTTIPAGCVYGEGCLNAYGIPSAPGPCTMKNGTVQTCDCDFTDSGGSGSNYAANENKTFTICPDPAQPGAKIQIDFTSFNTQQSTDFLYIYDGNTATGQPIVSVSGNNPTAIQNIISATLSNSSGCLTIVFTSNGSTQAAGWLADVSCYVPCTNPVANATVNGATQQTIRVCPGAQINFNGSSSVSNATSITNYSWDFDNGVTGTNASQTVTYNTPGRYIPYLTVTNNQNCKSTNALPYEIIVSTVPNFVGTTIDQTACKGEPVCLTGTVNYPTLVDVPVMSATGSVNLPDGTGVAYENTIIVKGYDPGKKIQSAADLQSICVNMEHSAVDDIIITLIAPSGQQVVLHNRGGGASALGVPSMDASAAMVAKNCNFGGPASGPGTGWDYCFKMNATQTLAQNGNANWNFTTKPCYQIPAGNYLPVGNFTSLIGADLNGAWTIRYEDASANDDGYLFGWNLNFNTSLLPTNATIAPTASTQSWAGPATINSNSGNQVCASPTAVGVNTYTYSVTNSFGCSADTTIDITVKAIPTLTPTVSNPSSCNGTGSIALTLANVPNGSYTISYAGGSFTNVAVTTNAANIQNVAAGTYNDLQITVNGCTSVLGVNALLTAPGSPNLSAVENNATTCGSNGSINLTFTNVADGTYTISYTGGSFTTVQVTNNTATIQNVQPGNYNDLQVTSNGCPSPLGENVIITAPTPPAAPTATLTQPTCSVSTGTIEVTNPTGTSLEYSVDGTNYQASTTFSSLAAATYSVTVKNITTGCISTATSYTLNTPVGAPTVTITAATPTTFCQGGSVDLNATTGTGYAYQWSLNGTNISGATNSTYNVNASGTYTLTVTANGCSASDQEVVTVNSLPTVDAGNFSPICSGTKITLSGSGASTYVWDNGVTDGNVFAPNGTTTYTVTGTDLNGCVGTDQVTVTVLPLPVALFASNVAGGQAPLIVNFTNTSSNANDYSWDFANGVTSNTNDLTVSTSYSNAGVYNVILVASNGVCDSIAQLTITVGTPPPMEIFVPNVFTPNDKEDNEGYWINVINGKSFEGTIFNRWGNVMYTMSDLNQKWDGNYNGKPAADGVYFIKYKVTALDDTIKEGHTFFHLIR